MHNTNKWIFTQSTVFIIPGQSLQNNIVSYLKGHWRFCFQIFSLWIPQLEEIIWANNKQNRIPEINKHRRNGFQFTHFWVLLVYDYFTLSLNYTASQFLTHRYASKNGISSEECPQSDAHSRLFQLKEVLKIMCFLGKTFTIKSSCFCESLHQYVTKKQEPEISTKAKQLS